MTTLFAQAIAEQKIFHVYAPYDIPLALNRFIKKINPRLTVVMETELWPNMIHCCFVRRIPVLLANARLSEKSARGYARLSGLTKEMLSEVTVIAAQNQQDGDRFTRLGLDSHKLKVTGSIKFDLDLSVEVKQKAVELKKAWSNNNERLVLLAASTHQGEDEIIINAFKKWKKIIPDLLLVLVPRHPERFNNIYQLCVDHGFKTRRRSEMEKSAAILINDIDILIGDTMGELLAFYGASDIAFVGGSLIPVGGHNLIEPAAWALPMVCGKHLFNFAEVSELLIRQNALFICETEDDLEQYVETLLLGGEKRKTMGLAAQKVAHENRGALQRLLLEIKPFLL